MSDLHHDAASADVVLPLATGEALRIADALETLAGIDEGEHTNHDELLADAAMIRRAVEEEDGGEVATVTVQKRRDEVVPGDVIHSSHGYRLLVIDVDDTAEVRTDERHIGFSGYLHADRTRSIRSERYPAGSLVTVEVPEAPPSLLTVTFDVTGMSRDEVDHLETDLSVQGESSDDHGEARFVGGLRRGADRKRWNA